MAIYRAEMKRVAIKLSKFTNAFNYRASVPGWVLLMLQH